MAKRQLATPLPTILSRRVRGYKLLRAAEVGMIMVETSKVVLRLCYFQKATILLPI